MDDDLNDDEDFPQDGENITEQNSSTDSESGAIVEAVVLLVTDEASDNCRTPDNKYGAKVSGEEPDDTPDDC